MNSQPLGLNGGLLILILALLLMNVPITEAKLDWSEGTKGTFAMVGWIILTVTTFSGMVAMMVCGYRTLFGHRAVPSKEETSRRIRESTAWLSYVAWIRIDLRAARDLERVAAARVIDLESQLFGDHGLTFCWIESSAAFSPQNCSAAFSALQRTANQRRRIDQHEKSS